MRQHDREKRRPDGGRVPAVARTALVLRTLVGQRDGLRHTELSDRLQLSKSSLSDLLGALEEQGFVERDPGTGAFRLGPALVMLGTAARSGMDVVRAARPLLIRLRDVTAETVILHAPERDGIEASVLDAIESEHQLKVVAPIGHRLPPFAGSVSKVFLAAASEPDRRAAVEQASLPTYTRRTVHDAEAYLAELQRVAADGFAVDDEEYLAGVRAVSAPIRDHTGATVAALTVVGAASRLAAGSPLTTVAGDVAGAAHEVSERLGAPDPAHPQDGRPATPVDATSGASR